ncbi:MAG: hypothetical protein DRP09_16880 [Candidatus Thorarchaeota archaeon]|nr:MAG: hypothetical protein DRP09_16880 [Candidatus Thorarchaeota archaeon]
MTKKENLDRCKLTGFHIIEQWNSSNEESVTVCRLEEFEDFLCMCTKDKVMLLKKRKREEEPVVYDFFGIAGQLYRDIR